MKPRVIHLGRIVGRLCGREVNIDNGMVIDLDTPKALDEAANSGFMSFDLDGNDADTLALVTEEKP